MQKQNRLRLDGGIASRLRQEVWYRQPTSAGWTGSLFKPDEVATMIWKGGAKPEQEPEAIGFIEMKPEQVGSLNDIFPLFQPTEDETWQQLRQESEQLEGWQVHGVPYPDKTAQFYIVSRPVALLLCAKFERADAVTNLLVPVQDVALHEENKKTFQGFMSGPMLLAGLQGVASQ